MKEENITYKLGEKFDVEVQNDSEILAESFDLTIDYANDTVAPATFETLNLSVSETLSAVKDGLTTSVKAVEDFQKAPAVKVVSFIGDICSTAIALYNDIKDRNISSALLDTLKGIAKILDPIAKKMGEAVPLFGLAGSMASFSKAISTMGDEMSKSGDVSQSTLDNLMFSGIDLVKNTLKTAAFFFPVGLLGKGAFMGLTDVIALAIKTIYIKTTNKDKSVADAIAESMFGGVYKTVDGIKSFFKDKTSDYDDIDDSVKNASVITDSSTKITYDYSTENVLRVTNNYNQTTIYNMSEVVKNITATGSAEVYNYSDGVTITGDDSGNVIYNYGKDVTIECKGGNDTVYNMGDNVTIKGVTGQNEIYSTGDNVKVIELVDGNNKIETDDGDDTIKVNDRGETDTEDRYYNNINAGGGNNYIYNSNVELSTITTGDGNDTIITGGGNSYSNSWRGHTSINAGDGDNKITVNTEMSYCYIYSGDGNDYVTITGNGYSNAISLGGGADSFIGGVSHSTVNVGSGDDSVSLNTDSQYNVIWLSGGNDIIRLDKAAGHHTITGGAGDDTIYSKGISNKFMYTSGDGNDVIYNMSSSDTLVIGSGSGTYSTTNSGNDLIITAGTGSVRLKNVSKITPRIQGSLIAGGGNTTIGGDDTDTGGDDINIDGLKINNEKSYRFKSRCLVMRVMIQSQIQEVL